MLLRGFGVNDASVVDLRIDEQRYLHELQGPFVKGERRSFEMAKRASVFTMQTLGIASFPSSATPGELLISYSSEG